MGATVLFGTVLGLEIPVMIDDKDSQDSQDKIKIAIFILKPHLIWITI